MTISHFEAMRQTTGCAIFNAKCIKILVPTYFCKQLMQFNLSSPLVINTFIGIIRN